MYVYLYIFKYAWFYIIHRCNRLLASHDTWFGGGGVVANDLHVYISGGVRDQNPWVSDAAEQGTILQCSRFVSH